jgi:flagellar hook-basal body complex protein FliE
MIPIGNIAPASQVLSAYNGSPAKGAAGTDFASMVGDAAESALQSLRVSEQTTAAGVAGKADVQQVVQALGDAQVTMQTVVAVRDKVLGAYNDIMRMTV